MEFSKVFVMEFDLEYSKEFVTGFSKVFDLEFSKEFAMESLREYFKAVRGLAATVVFSGHGGGVGVHISTLSGNWCLAGGRITLLDVYTA